MGGLIVRALKFIASLINKLNEIKQNSPLFGKLLMVPYAYMEIVKEMLQWTIRIQQVQKCLKCQRLACELALHKAMLKVQSTVRTRVRTIWSIQQLVSTSIWLLVYQFVFLHHSTNMGFLNCFRQHHPLFLEQSSNYVSMPKNRLLVLASKGLAL
jgi:hypothetical protein